MSDYYVKKCSYCGAINDQYHKFDITNCEICDTSLSNVPPEIMHDLSDKARSYQTENCDQYLRHLVHETILHIEDIKSGDDEIDIETSNFIFTFATENDCCNRVWIEHLEGVELVIGKEATDLIVKRKEVDESIDNGDGCEEAIIYTIVTTGGYTDIELRNNHNGYYGGKLILLSKKEK